MTITMYDATSPANLPPVNDHANDVAIAGYCDLGYAGDWIAMVHQYPVLSSKQRVLSIAGSTVTTARILDYEKGNPCYGNPDGVALWVLEMLKKGVFKPGAYADRSDMPAVQAAYIKHAVPRDKAVLWLAAPGANSATYLAQGFDAVQRTFAGRYDVSDVKEEFFPPLSVPAPVHPAPAPTPPHPTVPAPTFNDGFNAGFHSGFQGGFQAGWKAR